MSALVVPPLPPGATVLGVGDDLVDVARMRAALRRGRFARRWFNRGELDHAHDGRRSAETLAACWAAREAWAKATGLPLSTVVSHLAVTFDVLGAPTLALDPECAAVAAQPVRPLVSLGHDGGVAGAVAVCVAA